MIPAWDAYERMPMLNMLPGFSGNLGVILIFVCTTKNQLYLTICVCHSPKRITSATLSYPRFLAQPSAVKPLKS